MSEYLWQPSKLHLPWEHLMIIISFFNLNNQTHELNQHTLVVVELRDWKETL